MEASKYSEYMAKAEEATDRAAKALFPDEKVAWERIAEGYRDLARQPYR